MAIYGDISFHIVTHAVHTWTSDTHATPGLSQRQDSSGDYYTRGYNIQPPGTLVGYYRL